MAKVQKYLIYARVSPRGSDFEGDTSIPMQIEYCQEFIRGQHGEVVKVVSDEFASGKDMHRPAFQGVIDELETGTVEWDCLCVYNLSRLTRAPKDMYYIMELLGSKGKRFASATEPDFDFSTLHGELLMGIITHVNQYARKISAKGTRDRMLNLARNGYWPSGRVPFGYCRRSHKDNTLYIDPRKAAIVRDIFESYAADIRPIDLMHKYPEINRAQFFRLLQDQNYIGKLEWGGLCVPGKHDAIIDPDLFQRVQEKRAEKKDGPRPKAQKYNYLLTGLVYCHCGRLMTPASANSRSGKYHYYQCTDTINCKTRVSAERLEEAALDRIRDIKPDPVAIRVACEEVERERRKYLEEEIKPSEENVRIALRTAKAEQDKLIALLVNDNLSPATLTVLDKKIGAISQEVERLTGKLAFYEDQKSQIDSASFDMAGTVISMLERLVQAANASHDPEMLKMVYKTYLDKIQNEKNEHYRFFFKFPSCSSKSNKWWAVRDSNT